MSKVSVITYEGEGWAAGRMVGTNSAPGIYIGWGSGPGVASKADTSLFTEESEGRVIGIATMEDTGGIAKYQVEGTLTADSAKIITNAGNFTATTFGTLIVHTSFDGIVLDVGDQITFQISIDPS